MTPRLLNVSAQLVMGLIAVFGKQNLTAFHIIILFLTHLQIVAVSRDCFFHRGTIEESPLQLPDGPYEGAKPRTVLVSKAQWEERKLNGQYDEA